MKLMPSSSAAMEGFTLALAAGSLTRRRRCNERWILGLALEELEKEVRVLRAIEKLSTRTELGT